MQLAVLAYYKERKKKVNFAPKSSPWIDAGFLK